MWTFDGPFVTCLFDMEDTLRRTIVQIGDVSRIALMISVNCERSATSMTKLLMPRRSSVTVTSAFVMLPFFPPIAPVISDRSPGRSRPM